MTITLVKREYSPGKFTTDILVNGEIWTRAVGPDLLPELVKRIVTHFRAQPLQSDEMPYGC